MELGGRGQLGRGKELRAGVGGVGRGLVHAGRGGGRGGVDVSRRAGRVQNAVAEDGRERLGGGERWPRRA